MNKKSIITILIILIVPVLTFWGLNFSRDIEANAQSSGLPQIIKFSSTMCLECKQVEKIFEQLIPQYSGKIEYKQIIVDSGKDMNNPLIKKYKVTLVPTVVMLNSDGTKAQTIVGAVSKEDYEKCIKGLK